MGIGKKLAIGCFGVMVLTCAGVPTLLWSIGGGRPTIAVDYEAKLNERAAAVPEGDRAWPIYRELTAELQSLEELDSLVLDRSLTPESVEMDRLRLFVEANASLVERARAAGSKPGLGYVTSRENEASYLEARGESVDDLDDGTGSPRWLLLIELPHLSDARSMARLLAADLRVAAAEGSGDRVVRDLGSMLGLSRQAGEHDFLICQLVELAIRGLAFGEIEWVLRTDASVLSGSDLREIGSMLDSLDGGGRYDISYEGERLHFYDTIQRAYTDDGKGNGKILIDSIESVGNTSNGNSGGAAQGSFPKRVGTGIVRLFSMDRAAFTRVADELFDWAEHSAKRPRTEWQGPPPSDELERAYDGDEIFPLDYGMRLLSLLVPALGKASVVADESNARKDAVRIAVAAERFRRDEGRWPTRVEELTPTYLDTVPADPFAEGPLEITSTETGIVVYSVGGDRDDDGGRHGLLAKRWVDPAEAGSISNGDDAEGDWVLFPEPKRR